MNGEPVLDMVH